MLIVSLQWFSITVAGLLLFFLVRIIRSRPLRNHCLNCNYDLNHIESARCPECGFGRDDQKRLFLNRKNVFSIILVFFLAVDMLILPIVWRPNKYIHRIPDKILAHIAPLAPSNSKDAILYDEIIQRIVNRTLSFDANGIYVNRQCKNFDLASPFFTIRKQRAYFDPVLIQTNLKRDYVSAFPLEIHLSYNNINLYFDYVEPYGRESMIDNSSYYNWRDPTTDCHVELLSDSESVEIVLTIQQENHGLIDAYEFPKTQIIEVAGTRDAVISPMGKPESETVKRGIQKSISVGVLDVYANEGGFYIAFQDLVHNSDYALGFQLQIRHGDEILAESTFLRYGSKVSSVGMENYRTVSTGIVDYDRFQELTVNDATDVELHIIGDQEMSLRDVTKHRYWNGKLVLPLISSGGSFWNTPEDPG